eukprot:TRINITY_DN24129_c0_g1_i1.p1 TRINITY_DN24129_c0_g1~~TRINITY_DN24129_c0_g1_i1.p1  ORF type:complete len:487 (-),score=47.43 TRINITY_DN24129_c0_g1_i1:59-1519(-)
MHISERIVWRVAEPGRSIPVGTEAGIDWKVTPLGGDDGAAFPEELGGRSISMRRVYDSHLEIFLRRHAPRRRPWNQRPRRSRCHDGRFLLADPRVGLFHNQRLSYEAALLVAEALGRTLVLPGFFKFPHPDAYDGHQWVPVRRLFDWVRLRTCNRDVIDLGDLIRECGHRILDSHVTVPFVVSWMKDGMPWVNGTRGQLRWRSPGGNRTYLFKGLRGPYRETPITLDEPTSYLLRPFLEPRPAQAVTVRAHGLIMTSRGLPETDPVCFLPAPSIWRDARRFMELATPGPVLGMHLRVFKRGSTGSGEGPAMLKFSGEVDVEQEEVCKLEGVLFGYLALVTMHQSMKGWIPQRTLVASNEGDPKHHELFKSTVGMGFQGVYPLTWLYSPLEYARAVTIEESTLALRSVVVDCAILSLTDRFIGNQCSSMSHYVRQLMRSYLKRDSHTAFMIGGKDQLPLIRNARLNLVDLGQQEAVRRRCVSEGVCD